MTYSVHKNGAGLSRESQDVIAPGDYGLYTIGKNYIFMYHYRLGNLNAQETLVFTFSSVQFIHFRGWRK